MVNNFLITPDKILLLNGQISKVDYYISSSDLDDILSKKIDTKSFLEALGKDCIIVRPIGDLHEDVYKVNTAEVVRIGEKRW